MIEAEVGFSRGVNSSIHPMRLPKDALQYAVNISLDSTIPGTRPAFRKVRELVSSGTYQGGAIYHRSGVDYFVYVVSGLVHVFDTVTLDDTIIADALLSSGSVMHHFCQAERYMIIQDGADSSTWDTDLWPIILDGTSLVDQSSRRITAPYECVPKGHQMAYCHGRLFVATSYIYLDTGVWTEDLGNVGFVAGDLIKSSDPAEILNFTETNYLNGGGRIVPTQEVGTIQAMTVLRNNPTGTGQGPLVVSGENGWCAYQVDAERSQWFDIELGTVLYTGRDMGASGAFSYVHSNNGLIYMSREGLRMIHDAAAKSQGQAGLSNHSISAEVADALTGSTPGHPTPSVASASSRVYMTGKGTVSPYYDSLVVLNSRIFGSLTEDAPPIYEGEWTGLRFLQVVTGMSNSDGYGIYIVSQNASGAINLVELADPDPNVERPKCQIFTKYYNFGEAALNEKHLESVDLNIFDIQGEVTFKVYYRSEGSYLWGASREFTITANGLPQYIQSLRIPITNVINPTVNGGMAVGRMFQLCIEWTGVAKLGMFRINANEGTVPNKMISDTGEMGALEASTDLIDLSRYTYEVTL